jgi:hypothetical protein
VTPRFSIVFTGRNDGHGVDFCERFLNTLKFNHRELNARSIPHEFVLVEWAPGSDRPWLAQLVAEQMPELQGLFTTYVVDPRYQEALTLNPQMRYLEYIAKNVGIRRARGPLILATNCDICFSRPLLDALVRGEFAPRTVYRAARYDLKASLAGQPLSWEILEDPGNRQRQTSPLNPPMMAGATGDFVMADRETMHEMQGFNEIYRIARLSVDRNFLTKAYAKRVPIADIGAPVYHIDHAGSFRSEDKETRKAPQNASRGFKRWHARGVIYDNPPNWGLADAPARPVARDQWFLDFTWAAVPPLVDLQRILPAGDPGTGPPLRRYFAIR